MKTSLFLSLLFVTGILSFAGSATDALNSPQYSGINHIRFNQPEFDNSFAGNGFLLKYQNALYGVTVKHVLFEAKTNTMKTVELSPWLKEWRVHPLQSSDAYVVFGELINNDANERINMSIMQKDWMVFKIRENYSKLTPIELRKTPLTEGELLTAYGCSYARKMDCQQDQISGEFIRKEGNNLRIRMPDLNIAMLRGLSGSPVLDKDHKLVGIVSNVLPSQTHDGMDFAPANLDYLLQVLEKTGKGQSGYSDKVHHLMPEEAK